MPMQFSALTSTPLSSSRLYAQKALCTISYQYAISVLLLAHFWYSSIIRFYPQNPVLKNVHDESVKVYLPMHNGNDQKNPLCVESCVTTKFSTSPLFSSTIFDADAIQYSYEHTFVQRKTLCAENPLYDFLSICKFSTPTSTLLYSSIIRLYPPNPVFKIVHDKSVKVYLPMYNGNVQQNPLCVESCVTKKFSTSPLFSITIFDADANSVLLRAHLCTAVDSMRRKPFVRFFINMQIQYSYQHTFVQQYY